MYLTLFNPVDYNLPDSSVHEILWARILEWVAISSSRGSSPLRDWTWVSRIAGRFFTVQATREALVFISLPIFSNSPYDFFFDPLAIWVYRLSSTCFWIMHLFENFCRYSQNTQSSLMPLCLYTCTCSLSGKPTVVIPPEARSSDITYFMTT